MEVKIILTNHKKTYYAEAIYSDSQIVILEGATIFPEFASCIRGGKIAKSFRNNQEYVVNNKTVKKCVFKSSSTAAQFVTGRSVNGYNAWKVEPKKSLGTYLKEHGLR